MKIQGKAIVYGDDVDTDVIIPARYLNVTDGKALAAHCMEDLDENFAARSAEVTVLVAGENFGCGSSREHAPIAIKESGIKVVIAKSFARIFYRNAINTGLPIVEYDGKINDGDEVCVDFEKGEITDVTLGEKGNFPAFPPRITEIIESGGLLKMKI